MVDVKRSDPLARAGDWVEVHAPSGKPSRRGQITEVLGAGGHERYRVRWDEKHESILYPAGGVSIVHGTASIREGERGERRGGARVREPVPAAIARRRAPGRDAAA